MGRRLFRILLVLLPVVCIATSVLWVRGYWRADSILLIHAPRGANIHHVATVYCARGRIWFRIGAIRELGQPFPAEVRPWDIRYSQDDDPSLPAQVSLRNGWQWSSRLGFGALHDWGTQYGWRSMPTTRQVAMRIVLWDYGV